ncbi:MAB_1171c family putative transporter [Streptomyces sp. NPDC101227]|uniref:MAB_1171c family putative transporter n=1 Tax=Streptomyces sp. NPDC101227 TaxID=3366136 RepID=UPI003824F0E6
MNLYLHPVCAVVAWLAFAYKLSALRKSPRDYALIALCGALLFSALSFTLAEPSLYQAIDRLLGVPNSAALMCMGCVVALLACQQVVLSFWAHPPGLAWRRARPRVLAAVLVLAALIGLFVAMSPTHERPTDVSLYYAGRPLYAGYLLIFLAYYTFGEIETGRLSHRYANVSHRLWLRRGLRLTAAGSWLTLGFSLIRIADIVLAEHSAALRELEAVAWVCGDVGALLTHIGWTLPGWGPALSAPRRWLRAWRQYRRLRPLWHVLHEVTPTIELTASANGFWSRFRPSTLEFKVYRQVIEIRDGQLALRSYTDPEAVRIARELGRAAGRSGKDLQAIEEATQLASMVRSRERNTLPSAHPVPRAATGPQGSDLTDEINWLVKVAEAMRTCPHVAAGVEGIQARMSAPTDNRR